MTGILSSGEPGETEFSHGKGLRPSAKQRAQMNDNLPLAYPLAEDPAGPWEPSVYDQGKAVQRTDSAYTDAEANEAAAAYSRDNTTGTGWVRES